MGYSTTILIRINNKISSVKSRAMFSHYSSGISNILLLLRVKSKPEPKPKLREVFRFCVFSYDVRVTVKFDLVPGFTNSFWLPLPWCNYIINTIANQRSLEP